MQILVFLVVAGLACFCSVFGQSPTGNPVQIVVLNALPVPEYNASSKFLTSDPYSQGTVEAYKQAFLDAEDPRLFHQMTITGLKDLLLANMKPADADALGQVCEKLSKRSVLIGKEAGIYAPIQRMFTAPENLTAFNDSALIRSIASLRDCIVPISDSQFKHYPAGTQYKILIDMPVEDLSVFKALDMDDLRKIAFAVAKQDAQELADGLLAPDVYNIQLRGMALAALGFKVSSGAPRELRLSAEHLDALIAEVKAAKPSHTQWAVDFLTTLKTFFPFPK